MPKRLFITALFLCAGMAPARSLVVRVAARDFHELSSHIAFKGTSLEIVGGRPGESYELLLDERDLPAVQASGLKAEIVVPDLEYWQGLVATDGAYHTYDEHNLMLHDWATLYPDICRLESLGPSYEGRWIYGLKISDEPQVEDPSEPEMLLYGVMHGREWIGGEMVRYAIDTLLANYATDPSFRDWVDHHQLWVFPVFNVDGYSYDYPAQRLWRKNRQPFGGAIGTDMNRNGDGACQGAADLEWGSLVSGSQTSHLPSHLAFAGPRGVSAPEVQSLVRLFKRHTFQVDVSIHAYTELLLWPWGISRPPPYNDFIATLGQRAAAQIGRLSGGTYMPEQAGSWYPTNMVIEDYFLGWARTLGGFACPSYTFEVGTTFYQPVEDLDLIQPEVFKGIWVMMQHTDSVKAGLKGMVPWPVVAPVETTQAGDYVVHWTPVRPEYNTPDRWELEELQGLAITSDSLEAGTAGWVLEGADTSGAQSHSGTHSIFLGSASNMSNWAVTRDPYPVTSADDSVTFWAWYDLEENYDIGVCEVSLEGREWFQLHDRYTGNSGGWVRKAYSLAPWLGKSVFIRFHACSDDGTNLGGMYIDDVSPVPSFAPRTIISDNLYDTLCTFSGRPAGRYYYRVRGHNAAWDWGVQGPLSTVVVGSGAVAEEPFQPAPNPARTEIVAVTPNPVVGRAVVSYSLARASGVSLDLLDATGRVATALEAGRRGAGQHSVSMVRTAGIGRGVYFLRLRAEGSTATRKLAVEQAEP
jgi:Zinc carboxypeptidase/Immune inhibitor A-like, MAM domain